MSEWNPDDLSTYSSLEHPGVAKNAINLIKKGADPNKKDDELQSTPLIKTTIGINEYSFEVAKVLIENGANVNLTNSYGVTALHELISHHKPGHFCYDYQLKGAQFLIDNGAEINTHSNGFCSTPLHYAVYMNAKDMVSLLIKNGANREIKNSDGQTPKELAIQEGFSEIAELF